MPTASVAGTRLAVHVSLLLLSLPIETTEGAKGSCLQSTYALQGACNGSFATWKGCFPSQQDSDNCTTFAGKFIDGLIKDTTCPASLPPLCAEIGGSVKPNAGCSFACDALRSSARSSCASDSECVDGSIDVCEAARQASFGLSGLCCSYVYRIAQEQCVSYDCDKLNQMMDSLRLKGSTAGGCDDTGCLLGPNVTVDRGLRGMEDLLQSARAASATCGADVYGGSSECVDLNYTLQGACNGVLVSQRACVGRGVDQTRSCNAAGLSVDGVMNEEACRGVIAPLCEAVGGSIRCDSDCRLLCPVLGAISATSCASDDFCRSPPAANPLPSLCCSSLRRLILSQCQAVQPSSLDAYLSRMARQGGSNGGCVASGGCLSLPVCTKAQGLDFCATLDGGSFLNPALADNPGEWDASVAAGWSRLPPEVFTKDDECLTAYKQWVCALNAQPCGEADNRAVKLCLDPCQAYMRCNVSLYAAFNRGEMSENQLNQLPAEICRTLEVRGNTDCYAGNEIVKKIDFRAAAPG
eukprot:CAMPEP_0173458970 /NCGR_PEP_ID=MMETSP1357-20121228/60570_1 /TAXON_ID=77926 /ORGANISM="Hemiselmis rufescens, Strain PCC563" /LENGTH=523 /DNA_ID=CAMNT_0014426389 /DNA_START=8 /DNA_END=1575 /DNA_ORIENTATION=-